MPSAAKKRASLYRFHAQYAKDSYPVTLRGTSMTITKFFDSNYKGCQEHFRTQKVASDPKTGEPVSYAQLQNRALQSIAKAESAYRNFNQKMAHAIRRKFLECKDIDYTADPEAKRCSANGLLNPQNPSFCAGRARTCANDVSACFFNLKGEIKNQEARKDFHTSQLNQKLASYRKGIKTQLKTITKQVKQFNASLRQRFPFLPPLALEEGNLFVKSGVAQYTEELRAAIIEGGNPEEVQEKFEQLIRENIITALAKQRTALQSKIDASIDETRENLGKGQRILG